MVLAGESLMLVLVRSVVASDMIVPLAEPAKLRAGRATTRKARKHLPQRKPPRIVPKWVFVNNNPFSELLMNETIVRNYKECVEAVATGNVSAVARKVARSCAIIREKNTLSTLENVVLRSVESAAASL